MASVLIPPYVVDDIRGWRDAVEDHADALAKFSWGSNSNLVKCPEAWRVCQSRLQAWHRWEPSWCPSRGAFLRLMELQLAWGACGCPSHSAFLRLKKSVDAWSSWRCPSCFVDDDLELKLVDEGPCHALVDTFFLLHHLDVLPL